jgi:hypothetical protein
MKFKELKLEVKDKYDFKVVMFLCLILNFFLAKRYFDSEVFVRFWDYRDHIASVNTLSLKLSQLDLSGFVIHWLDSAGGGYPPTFLFPVILVGAFVKVTPLIFSLILILVYSTCAGVVANKLAEFLLFTREIRLLFVALVVTNPVHLNLLFEGFPDGAFIFFVLLAVYLGLKCARSGQVSDLYVALIFLVSVPFIRKTYIYFSLAIVISLLLTLFVHHLMAKPPLTLKRYFRFNELIGYRAIKIASALGFVVILLGLPLIPSFFGWDAASINYVFSVSFQSYIYGMIEMNGSFVILFIFISLSIMPLVLSLKWGDLKSDNRVQQYLFLLSTYPLYLAIKIFVSGVSTHHILIQYSQIFALIIGFIFLNFLLRRSKKIVKVTSTAIVLSSVLFSVNFLSPAPAQLYKSLNSSPLFPAWAPPVQEVSVESWGNLICDLLGDAMLTPGMKKIGVINSSFEINDGKFVGAFDASECEGDSENQLLERKKFNQYANSTFFDKNGNPIIQIPQIANFDRLGGELFAGYEHLDYLVISNPDFSNFSSYKQRISKFLWEYAHRELIDGNLSVFSDFKVGASALQQSVRITPGRASGENGMLVLKRNNDLDLENFRKEVLQFLKSNTFNFSDTQSRNIPLSYTGDKFDYPSATYSDWRSELSGRGKEIAYSGYSLNPSQFRISIKANCSAIFSVETNSGSTKGVLLNDLEQDLNIDGYFQIKVTSTNALSSCQKFIRIS